MELNFKKKYTLKSIILNQLLEIFFYLFTSENKRDSTARNIIIIEPYQLGDLISISSMLDPIREYLDDSNIYIITKSSNSEVFKKDKRIKDVFFIDFPWTKHGKKRFFFNVIKQYKYLKSLRSYHFYYGFETRGDIISQFVLKIINCNKIIGYIDKIGTNIKSKGLLLDLKVEANKKYFHRYESNRFLLTALGIEEKNLFPIVFPILNPISENKLNKKKIILIHIGSGWIYRRWKLENWKIFIESILKDYDIIINLICGINENDQLDELRKKLPNKSINLNYIYSKSYDELYYNISICDYFVGLDSGPLHIADCLNKPCLALFGPGISELWKPISFNSHYIHNIQTFLCHPCNQRDCVHKDYNCMDAINVKEVLNCFNLMINSNLF